MKMLHEITKKQQMKPEMKCLIDDFMSKFQPNYPHKLSVEYKREGEEAIPLGMQDKYSNAIPLEMGNVYN